MTDPARIAVEQPLLDIQDLEVSFRSNSGAVPAVRGVSLTVYPGQTVAIVGESGSGKSTTAHSIINLLPGTGTVTAGRIEKLGIEQVNGTFVLGAPTGHALREAGFVETPRGLRLRRG